jgi:hypothetical protein
MGGPLGLLLGLLTLSILLTAIPRASLASGAKTSIGRGQSQASGLHGIEEAAAPEFPTNLDEGPSPLAEVFSVRIGTAEGLYRLTDPVPLFSVAESIVAPADDFFLQAFLVFNRSLTSRDDHPIRPTPWPEAITIPSGSSRSLPSVHDIQPILRESGFDEEGQVAVELVARDRSGKVAGWIRSNRVIIKLTHDHKTKTTNQQQNVGPESFDPERKKEEEPKDNQSKEGDEDPGLGASKRLPDVELTPEAVLPLLSEGESIKKEVNVWEAEQKLGSSPPPKLTLPEVTVPHPTFLKRPEDMEKQTLSPREERLLLRRYFEQLRGKD